jgi:hypothetical protein
MSRLAEKLTPQTYGDLFTRQPAPRSPKLMPEEVPIDVCVLFDRLALRVANAGHKRFSSDAILHRIRWEHQVEKGDREFKCNDHWTAPLARWFLANHPELPEFFALRKLKEDRDVD